MKRLEKPANGTRFARLTVKEIKIVNCAQVAVCKCDCGKISTPTLANLLRGHSKSCGCLGVLANQTHRDYRTPEYRAWEHIVQRCANPKSKSWDNYGGRGIKICAEWRNDYTAFLAHVGRRPSSEHSIDRTDNDGNYEPGNVRWATRKEQAENSRRNHLVTINGETHCIAEWSRRTGINRETLRVRAVAGQSFAILRRATHSHPCKEGCGNQVECDGMYCGTIYLTADEPHLTCGECGRAEVAEQLERDAWADRRE